jgi:hypothetical protein
MKNLLKSWMIFVGLCFCGILSVNAQTVTLPAGKTGFQVNLAWTAPTSSSDPVAGYDIYRELSSGTSYTQLNTTELPLTPTTYTDTNVVNGDSYNYIAKSVDSSGILSSPSNTATVPIPTIPAPPTIGTLHST